MRQILFIVTLALAATIIIAPVQAKTYKHQAYTAEYPNGCKQEKGGKYQSHSFNVECKGNAGYQIESGETFTSYFTGDTDQELLDDLESVMQKTWDTETVESGVDKYTVNNHTAPYVIGSYEQEYTNWLGLPADSRDYAMFASVVDIGNDQKVVFEYRNDAKNFDKGLPAAINVMQSINPTGAILEDGNKGDSTDTDTSCDSLDAYPALQKLCRGIS